MTLFLVFIGSRLFCGEEMDILAVGVVFDAGFESDDLGADADRNVVADIDGDTRVIPSIEARLATPFEVRR